MNSPIKRTKLDNLCDIPSVVELPRDVLYIIQCNNPTLPLHLVSRQGKEIYETMVAKVALLASEIVHRIHISTLSHTLELEYYDYHQHNEIYKIDMNLHAPHLDRLKCLTPYLHMLPTSFNSDVDLSRYGYYALNHCVRLVDFILHGRWYKEKSECAVTCKKNRPLRNDEFSPLQIFFYITRCEKIFGVTICCPKPIYRHGFLDGRPLTLLVYMFPRLFRLPETNLGRDEESTCLNVDRTCSYKWKMSTLSRSITYLLVQNAFGTIDLPNTMNFVNMRFLEHRSLLRKQFLCQLASLIKNEDLKKRIILKIDTYQCFSPSKDELLLDSIVFPTCISHDNLILEEDKVERFHAIASSRILKK